MYDYIFVPVLDCKGNVEAIAGTTRDITNQVEARKQKEENEQRYSQLIHSSPSAIGVLNGENLIIAEANESILEIWGKSNEIIGKPFFEVLPELVEQDYKKVFDEIYRTGKPINAMETPVSIFKDGEMKLKYYNFLLYPQRNTNSQIVGIGIIASEVTSQALLNNKIKESEEHFRIFSNNIQNLAWIADGDGNIFWYNQRWLDYTGLSLDEMKGWGWQKVHHPDHVERIVEISKKVMENK